jgi:hypothetical protein
MWPWRERRVSDVFTTFHADTLDGERFFQAPLRLIPSLSAKFHPPLKKCIWGLPIKRLESKAPKTPDSLISPNDGPGVSQRAVDHVHQSSCHPIPDNC